LVVGVGGTWQQKPPFTFVLNYDILII